MMFSTLVALLPLLAGIAAADVDEVVHAAVIFSRHGDRNWKGQPPTRLTTLGQQQVFQSGQFWRDRYINGTTSSRIHQISTEVYDPNHVSAYSPDQPLLATTGMVFMQGLYPPNPVLNVQILGGGKVAAAPLDGAQFPAIHTIPDDSPQTIWLKGDDMCPKFDEASKRYKSTDTYNQIHASTKAFYDSLYDRVFAGVLDKSAMSYDNAYTIFDYVNVGVVHNDTVRNAVTNPELYQLRVLADSLEWEKSGNVPSHNTDDVLAVAGRTLAANVVKNLQSAISSRATSNKLTLLVGSYDTFLAFFGLAGLPKVSPNFRGLPDYTSAMSFELFSVNEAGNTDFPSTEDALKVRFVFRNGTQQIAEYPLFTPSRSDAVMAWPSFRAKMQDIGLESIADWCQMCASEAAFCHTTAESAESADSGSRLSPTVAGVVGAMAALGAVVFAVMLGLFLGVRMVRISKVAQPAMKEVDTESEV